MGSKSAIIPMILAALVGGVAALLLSQLQFRVWLEPSTSDQEQLPIINVNPPDSLPGQENPGVPTPLPEPTPPVENGLRVSNQTPYPLRVVLLPRQGASGASQTAPPFQDPVHWDFEPAEGRQQGLLLSLPESELRLIPGDVLVAFSLDGSRRYWGPYVVGETPTPSQAGGEWRLILTP
ncbi:hypothetical protein GS597_05360 [Synechococcales cyanobacterium C]|uniref:Uncharacterized protein n=1 Tax=Petrachloros mirabilis ULC683 TaxID=2781853 RepID=A0A8K2A793_9CYAN|nr:hypothetical protein [Petrachloros mirabilis]NCJ05949.1 hypothetical protein [Petrachloros mirabilis ULC683]